MSDAGSAAVLEELVSANRESSRTMLALVETVRLETAARDRKVVVLERQHQQLRLAIWLVCVGILVLLGVAAINAVNIANTRRQQAQTAKIAAEVDRTNRTLLDCINQTGECGQINSRRQMQLLDEVKRYELTGFYCIRNNPAGVDPGAVKFLACMQRLYPGGPTLEKR